MNRRRWIAAVLGAAAGVVLLWSLREFAPVVHADPHAEITRLAELMQWKPGTIVADIGAGDGSYTFVAAEIVGPSGHVYATEIDQAKLKELRAQVDKRKLSNVTVIESAADDTKLADDCCDAIFLRRVYHHITHPAEFDRSLVRSLRPGARLAIIEFPPGANSELPEGVPKNRGGHGIPQKIMVDELTSAGLQVEKTISDWSGRDYCVIFVKRTE
jgi:SAM-dependent methyltransferase